MAEEGVQEEERDATCPCAEIEDGEGAVLRAGALLFGEDGGEVEGVGLSLGSGGS